MREKERERERGEKRERSAAGRVAHGRHKTVVAPAHHAQLSNTVVLQVLTPPPGYVVSAPKNGVEVHRSGSSVQRSRALYMSSYGATPTFRVNDELYFDVRSDLRVVVEDCSACDTNYS